MIILINNFLFKFCRNTCSFMFHSIFWFAGFQHNQTAFFINLMPLRKLSYCQNSIIFIPVAFLKKLLIDDFRKEDLFQNWCAIYSPICMTEKSMTVHLDYTKLLNQTEFHLKLSKQLRSCRVFEVSFCKVMGCLETSVLLKT